MESLTIEAFILLSGAGIVLIEKTCKKIFYLNEKRKLKKKIIKSIQENNKTNIKKYIIKLKDFDEKYKKKKLLKYLEYCCRNINDLNENNIYSLIEDFNFIDMIYNNEKDNLEEEIHDNLDEKLQELEKKRKMILSRSNQLQAKAMLKNHRMSKNVKKTRGKLG
tara:strand:+ start:155 stop:646 length:492 start_codon:yes stop_codon:yes gene_type:complete